MSITETESGHLCSLMWITHRFPLGDFVNTEIYGNTIGKIPSKTWSSKTVIK